MKSSQINNLDGINLLKITQINNYKNIKSKSKNELSSYYITSIDGAASGTKPKSQMDSHSEWVVISKLIVVYMEDKLLYSKFLWFIYQTLTNAKS